MCHLHVLKIANRADPWLVCMVLVLCHLTKKLACRDAFSMLLKDIEEMLLSFFILYEKSPKKIRELGVIVDNACVSNPNGGDITHRGPGGLTASVKHCSMLLIGMVPTLLI